MTMVLTMAIYVGADDDHDGVCIYVCMHDHDVYDMRVRARVVMYVCI